MKNPWMKRAVKAIEKSNSDWNVEDASDILLAADEVRKDKVLMKQITQLMDRKKAQLDKITSMDQLKSAALKVSKR